jgi:retron-type reverse transcriptase
MEAGTVRYSESGTSQGGVISPLLSNIYLHEVLDDWYVTVVHPRLEGKSFMVRYADDAVIGCEKKSDQRSADADRIMKGKIPPI